VVRLITASAVTIPAFNAAEAQQDLSESQQGGAGATPENNGQDFTRPETLFQARYVYQTAPGDGVLSGTMRSVATDLVVLRSDLKVDLAPDWTLALRGDLPFAAKNAVTTDDQTGEYAYGIGDGDVQAAIIRTLNARWAAGVGLRIIAPTGTSELTAGSWRALPMIGARVMLPELSNGSFFTGLVRYEISVAMEPGAKYINNLQFAPTLNINLPDRWFLTFYPSPDIRINYGDPITGQTGRLFVPLDLSIGRAITKDITASLEIGVPLIQDYPVYDFKTVSRLNVRF
jgi:hypothetical protein